MAQVGERLGRHRRNGRFQDLSERGVEEERPQEINTNNERYYDDFFSYAAIAKDATRISAPYVIQLAVTVNSQGKPKVRSVLFEDLKTSERASARIDEVFEEIE